MEPRAHLSLPEVADALGISYEAVRSRWQRYREQVVGAGEARKRGRQWFVTETGLAILGGQIPARTTPQSDSDLTTADLELAMARADLASQQVGERDREIVRLTQELERARRTIRALSATASQLAETIADSQPSTKS